MKTFLYLTGCLCLFLKLSSAHLVFDMSHDFSNATHNWPDATKIKIIPSVAGYAIPDLPEDDENNFWIEVTDIVGEVHLGTHLDAPVHFAKGEWTVDQIPPERFFGPVSIVDLRHKVKDNADYEITVNDLAEWEIVNRRKFDPLIVLWTGWGSRWADRSRYMGTQSDTDASNLHHFPGLSRDGAEWLAKHGGIHGVGIDTASLDYGQSKDFMAHRTLLKNRIFIMEYLNTDGLESFPLVNPYLIVTPLKITGGSGSPVRALLLSQLPDDSTSKASRVLIPSRVTEAGIASPSNFVPMTMNGRPMFYPISQQPDRSLFLDCQRMLRIQQLLG